MKKINIRNVCYMISAVLGIAFVIKTIINYVQYDALFTSAPFYVCILVNAVFLITPALLVLVIGIILGAKRSK